MENKDLQMNETAVLTANEQAESLDDTVEEVKYVEKSSLTITEQRIKKIMYKPFGTLIAGVFFSVLFIAMMNVLTIVLGIFILALTLFVQFVVKDYVTMEIYPTYVLIYKLDSDSLVRKVMYNDLEEWTSKDNEGKSSCIMFKLKTGEIIYKDTFQAAAAYNQFKKLMPLKESHAVAHRKTVEKNKNVKMKFKLPFKWPFNKK